jgi:23S rRNA (guanine745-N1)-methyltransferase
MLICPVCTQPLVRVEKSLSCENKHCFDQAKQGYFNLLLNPAKKSNQPGDNNEMVQARTRFLDAGHYQSISDAINQMAVDLLWQQQDAELLDVGCGEGYYTQRLHHALTDHQINHQLYGLDISKDAIKSACRRTKDIHWLVANGKRAPFSEQSMHLTLNVFNRIMPDSLKNLCHPQGHVIIASAGAYHLQQLKEAIYDTPKFVEFDAVAVMKDHFKHELRQQLDFVIKLPPASTQDLLYMTPHAWRSSPQTQQQLLSQEQLELRVHINLDCFSPLDNEHKD